MSVVAAQQRFAKSRRCPICDGAPGDVRGAGKRCSGFVSPDGFIHCSREEFAGAIAVSVNSQTYGHKPTGTCLCGSTHGETELEKPPPWKRPIEATYDYCDDAGKLSYQVVRFADTKDFTQRRPGGPHGWTWSLNGIHRVLYRRDEIIEADPSRTVYIVEGEKDVEALRKLGQLATTNAMGAGKWATVDADARVVLRDRRVAVIADADAAGRKHADEVAAAVRTFVADVKKLELPGAKDAHDWIAAGGTAEKLAELAEQAGRPQPKWRIESASSDWITEKLPPREHLLVDERTGRGAMDKTGVWLAGGAGGAGKSYATIGLGLAVASGKRWLETFTTGLGGRVLIVAAEDARDDIRRRVHAIAAATRIPSDAMERLHVLPIHDRMTSLVAKSGDAYAPGDDTKTLCDELARSEPYDLVIVDPYGRIAGVSVDADNAAAAATIGALNMIATAARGLVLGVTHTSLRARIAAQNGAAEGATAIRGATGQSDYARGVLRLEADKSAIWLSLAKANHVPWWEPVALRRGEHGELVPMDAADIAEIVAAKSSDGKAAKREAAIAERDELDDGAARQAIADNPSASLRALRALVSKARRCGKDRADNAISRCRQ